MFSVSISNEALFSSFLDSGEHDYVDVYLHDTVAMFIMNNSDIFSILSTACSHTPNETSHGFRLPQNLLKQQKRADTITIHFNEDGTVSVSFMLGKTLICDTRFIYQKVYSTAYEHKLQLLRSAVQPCELKIDLLKELIKICNTLGGVINVDSGVAGAILLSGIRIYKSVPYRESLCISPKYAQILRTCDNSLFVINNFVGAYANEFAVLINKLRVVSNQEFFMLKDTRSKYKADLDISNLIAFARSHSVKIPIFEINLDSKCCSFQEGDISYRIPVDISSEVRAKADSVQTIEIPLSIIKNILPALGSHCCTIEQKQFFTKLTVNDYIIIFN